MLVLVLVLVLVEVLEVMFCLHVYSCEAQDKVKFMPSNCGWADSE